MHRIKSVALAAVGAGALFCLAAAPAGAAGLLFAPWVLGHLLRAAALPLIVAAAAASASENYNAEGAPYPESEPGYAPGYYPPPAAGYAPPAYYAAPPAYAPPVRYYAPPAYYGAPAYYAPAYRPAPYVRYYAPRGYDAAPRLRYSAPHGAQGWYGSRGYYRRR